MDRTEEFYRICATKDENPAPIVPFAPLRTSNFRIAAVTIAQAIGDVHAVVRSALSSRYPSIAELMQVERDATRFSQQCGNDLAALERKADEAYSMRRAQALTVERALHEKGIVSNLYQRLQALMKDLKAIRPLSRQLAFAQLADKHREEPVLQPGRKVTPLSPSLPSERAAARGAGADAHSTSMSAQEQIEQQHVRNASDIEHTMAEVSGMIDLISTKLIEQQETIEDIFNQAQESRQAVAKGNKELAQVTERPNLLRDITIIIFVVLGLSLWVLEWLYS